MNEPDDTPSEQLLDEKVQPKGDFQFSPEFGVDKGTYESPDQVIEIRKSNELNSKSEVNQKNSSLPQAIEIAEVNQQASSSQVSHYSQGLTFNSVVRTGSSQQSSFSQRTQANTGLMRANANINLKQSKMDHVKILFYNLAEPLIVATSLSVCLQLPMISGLVYLLITLIGIVPNLLNPNELPIRAKSILAIIMGLISLAAIATKSYFYHVMSTTDVTDSKTIETYHICGIWANQGFKTVAIDCTQFVVSIIYFFLYRNQLGHAKARELIFLKMEYQTEIKLLHPYFGRTHATVFKLVVFLYLVDCLILLTFVQLLVLFIVMFSIFMAIFTIQGWTGTERRINQIRVIQILICLQLIAIFTLQLPLAFDKFRQNNRNLLMMFGIFGLESKQENINIPQVDVTSLRTHLVFASFALALSEMYKVCVDVNQKAPQKSILGSGSETSAKFTVVQSKKGRQNTAVLLRPSKSSQTTDEGMSTKITKLWKIFETNTLLFFCRVLGFIWVYMYHDWQSVIILMAGLHSTIYNDSRIFRKWIMSFYLPCYVLIFLFYYITNIEGLIPQMNDWDQAKKNHYYNFGFYSMQYPPLETMFMFANVFFLALFANKVEQEEDRQIKIERYLEKVSQIHNHIWHQLSFLTLLFVQGPLMVVLILAGLDVMDVYHVALIGFFIVYMLYSEKLHNFALILLIYVDFFVLEKYVYSLCMKSEKQPNWTTILGLSTSYNPDQSNEYFRYPPKFDQYLLVVLAFFLYRRANYIGTDDTKIQILEKRSKAIIALKYPRLQYFKTELNILTYQCIVWASFAFFLMILILQQRTIINGTNQLILLSLICIYYSRGLKSLLTWWYVLITSTSIALVSEIAFQFMAQTNILLRIKNTHPNWWDKTLTPQRKDWINWIGFYKLPENQQSYQFFLPYLLLFAGAIILKRKFQLKLQLEMQEIKFDEENILLLTERNFIEERPNDDMETVRLDTAGEQLDHLHINNSETQSNFTFQNKQPTLTIRVEPRLRTQSVEINDRKLKEAEVLHVKQYLEMRYKLSFLIYKMRGCWRVLDIFSTYFQVILSTVILAYALYSNLSIIWALMLIFFMLQTISAANIHFKWRQEQRDKFKNQVHNNIIDERLDNMLEQSRKSQNKVHIVDRSSSHLQSPQVENKEAEEPKQKRVKVTDENAITEYNSFYLKIDQVTVKTRHYFWIIQYIIIMLAITAIYLFSFAHFWGQDWSHSSFSQIEVSQIIFGAFIIGFYTPVTEAHYFNDASPFYVVLVLLIFERLAQGWIIDRFGCDEETCWKFAKMIKINEEYIKLKEKRFQKKQKLNRSFLDAQLTAPVGGLAPIMEENSEVSQSIRQSEPQTPAELLQQAEIDLLNEQDNWLAFENENQVKDKRLVQVRQSVDLLKSGKFSRDGGATKQPDMRKSVLRESLRSEFSIVELPQTEINTLCSKRDELLEQIKVKFEIVSRIKLLNALKTIMEDFVILLVWVSTIYKQNVYSILLFVVLTVFAIFRTGKSVQIIRYTVVVVFVVEYLSALACLSSYNSPQPFPPALTTLSNGTQTVYPNEDNFFFYVPVYFGYEKLMNPNTPISDLHVDLNVTTYLGFPADAHRLNGMWIDYSVIILVMIYFNLCNFWLLFQPTEIVRSKNTNNQINQYIECVHELQITSSSSQEKKEKMTLEQFITYIDQQFVHVKVTNQLERFIFTYYALFVISFLLAVSIFNGSLVSFGYFISCMILIYLYGSLLTDANSRIKIINMLKYFLIPYILIDIGLNLIYQIPVTLFENTNSEYAQIIGFETIWTITPTTLTLGEQVNVIETKNAMTSYMMKGLTFFFISTMLQILSSHDFIEFQKSSISKLAYNQNKIGKGLAYRFNNFKCYTVIQQAKEVKSISSMLAHVKKLIMKRDKLYALQNNKSNRLSLDLRKKKQNLTQALIIPEELSDKEGSSDNSSDHQKFDKEKFEQEETKQVKQIYEKKISKLPCCQKLYLYFRHKFVSDILFRRSEEQLDDIVQQLYQGRTSVKCKLEIGTMQDAKKEYLEIVETERAIKAEAEAAKIIVLSDKDKDEGEELFEEEKKAVSLEGDKIDFDNLKGSRFSSEVLRQSDYLIKEVKDSKQSMLIEDDGKVSVLNLLQPETPVLTEEEEAIKQQRMRLLMTSDKPWEQVNVEKMGTWKKMIKRYVICFYKICVTYQEFFCYFWMLFATLTNGGVLYLYYPAVVFGYALLLEERPGKWFWYSVLAYTQILIVINFVLMLTIWQAVLSSNQQQRATNFFEKFNLGFKTLIYQGDWWKSLKQLLPEIFIICAVMILILQQTLAGVLGIPFREFESFQDGLLRYRLNFAETEEERQEIIAQMDSEEAIKIELDKSTIEPFRNQMDRRYSDVDRFEYSEKKGEPIRNDRLKLKQSNQASQVQDDFSFKASKKGGNEGKKRVLSADFARDPNFYHDEARGFAMPINYLRRFFWDNKFFERLFPLVKQQKPGIDMYVWIFLVQFLICLYILLFFQPMRAQQNSIAAQFSSNSLSGAMVVTLMVMVLIMVIDRVIYSTHTFIAFSDTINNSDDQRSELTGTPTPLDINKTIDSSFEKLPQRQREMSVDSSVGNRFDIYAQSVVPAQENFLDDKLAISDDDAVEVQVREFSDALVPQKQVKRSSRVLRVYFLWVLLILVHWFIFFYQTESIYYCKITPQIGADGQTITYDKNVDNGYNCNTFSSNGWLITFYILWCIYFALASSQIRVGLPQIRKGSFMVGEYDIVSCYTFRAYLAIPFIFELRTIIDWTFTKTALDVFQWMKLAEIQAIFYVTKCINASYFTKKLGSPIGKFFKIVQGFFLMIFVLVLLVGPILLFSQINPVGVTYQVSQGSLKYYISLMNNSTNTVSNIELFSTTQLSQNVQMNETQYNDMLFDYENDINFMFSSTTGQFTSNQTQIVQFSSLPDSVWTASPPKKQQLLEALQLTLNNQTTDITVTSVFAFAFTRTGSTDVQGYNSTVLTSNDTAILQGLINSIQCNHGGLASDTLITTMFPDTIQMTWQTSSQQNMTSMNTKDDVLLAGFSLNYNCTDANDANAYWELTQNFMPFNASWTEVQMYQYANMTEDIFHDSGFGLFVFSQKQLPSFLSGYSTNILVFYVLVVYVIATYFRSAFVPLAWQIFIWDAPFNEDILMICQSIHIYRVQMQLEKEEELYMILIDIMRSPEMIKSICGSSLKKKLQ